MGHTKDHVIIFGPKGVGVGVDETAYFFVHLVSCVHHDHDRKTNPIVIT